MTRRTRVFERLGDADIARQIANDHGLTPQVDLGGSAQDVARMFAQLSTASVEQRRSYPASAFNAASMHARTGGFARARIL